MSAQKLSRIKKAKRSIWYFLRVMLLIFVMILVCYCAFTIAMHKSNLHILATEGMQMRAECILYSQLAPELSEYFTPDFIVRDMELYTETYKPYTIKNYEYRLEIQSNAVGPLSSKATMVAIERMPVLDGSYNASDDQTEEKPEVPEWKENKYEIKFRKTDGRWFIDELNILGDAPQETPKPTPDMSLLEESPSPVTQTQQ